MKKITFSFLLMGLAFQFLNSQNLTNENALMDIVKRSKAQYNSVLQKAKSQEKNQIPIEIYENGERKYVLEYITESGQPVYEMDFNENSAYTISTNKVRPGGELGLSLTGKNHVIRLWEVNGLPRTSHVEFGNRIIIGDSEHEFGSHATHVGGTLIAQGVDPDAKGMAYEAKIKAFNTSWDESEMATEALNGTLISNHSYGTTCGWKDDEWRGDSLVSRLEDYKFGFYSIWVELWDEIAFNAPYYLICKSAGNDRNDSGDGSFPNDGPFDCLPPKANAKNILTVGAISDMTNGYTNASNVEITSFSSWGPTDDGRIKPDIVANGRSLYSSDSDDDSDYSFKSGTSMATPSLSGSLLLLQEHFYNLNDRYLKAATLKALTIHTADEAGSHDGPDYKFGWGVANIASAAQLISSGNYNTFMSEKLLNENDIFKIEVYADENLPLKATIVWTDPPGEPASIQLDPDKLMLINDLDLSIKSENDEVFYPYSLNKNKPEFSATNSSKNYTDNVEVVFIRNPVANEKYTIFVTHDSNLSNDSQAFSIVVTGIKNVDNDQDGYYAYEDCDDDNADVNPGQTEIVYNGLDDDCNVETLDDDLDQDGYLNADDCDDTNAEINPSQSEIVYNGLDDDCDAETLDDDLDQDGYLNAEDCDDNNADINPGKTEIVYNGLDDDCDAETLDDDLDQDGYLYAEDCDDTNAEINPGKTEIVYNGLDDDCDAETLDDDLDQDGFNYVDDCDDNNSSIYPGAVEIPDNGIDEDCDGSDLITSVVDLGLTNVNIYPNPAQNILYISKNQESKINIILYDLTGKQMIEFRDEKQLDIQNINNGFYLLKIIDVKSSKFAIKDLIISR